MYNDKLIYLDKNIYIRQKFDIKFDIKFDKKFDIKL